MSEEPTSPLISQLEPPNQVIVNTEGGVRHGQGKYVFSNGTTYVGTYMEGRKHGVGNLVFACSPNESVGSSISSYHGQFENGQISGEGTYRYPNGDVYAGFWLLGVKHGRGNYYYFSNGGSLEGEWDSGKFVQGTWTLPNGNIFEGCFQQGKPIGPGCWTVAEGSEKLFGEYLLDTDEKMKWKFTVPENSLVA